MFANKLILLSRFSVNKRFNQHIDTQIEILNMKNSTKPPISCSIPVSVWGKKHKLIFLYVWFSISKSRITSNGSWGWWRPKHLRYSVEQLKLPNFLVMEKKTKLFKIYLLQMCSTKYISMVGEGKNIKGFFLQIILKVS